jgi:hypothetical protein
VGVDAQDAGSAESATSIFTPLSVCLPRVSAE